MYTSLIIGVGSAIDAGVYILLGTVGREPAGPDLAISFITAQITAGFSALCRGELASQPPAFHPQEVLIIIPSFVLQKANNNFVQVTELLKRKCSRELPIQLFASHSTQGTHKLLAKMLEMKLQHLPRRRLEKKEYIYAPNDIKPKVTLEARKKAAEAKPRADDRRTMHQP
ncbi:hypothetical protein KSS87_018230 [Heliosperma pusillum]|nr:hypothetical protein KSS87_018230 [Heliosperma pusillum]